MPLHCKCWGEQHELWQDFGPPAPSMTGHAETLPAAADGSGRDGLALSAKELGCHAV